MSSVDDTDIALIGAGPCGVEMAVALKRAGFAYIHLEATQVGSTMAWWPPGTRWFSSNDRIAIAGIPLVTPEQEKATREEYLAYLRGVVQQFDLAIRLYEPVARIERASGGFVLHSGHRDSPRTLRAKRIILSTGGTATARLLNIPGENSPHVSHYMKDPHDYFRQRLLIVGGRNAAIEAALRCHRAGAAVTLSYRAPAIDDKHIKYWLWPEFDGLVKAGQITLLYETMPVEIKPGHVTLRHADGRESQVPADFVLLQTGYLADMRLFESVGVTLAGPQRIPAFNAQTMQTDVPGVYVCGTATAGTQDRYRVFLENCHVHVPRIIESLRGGHARVEAKEFASPET